MKSIKSKISLGLMFLFSVILLLSILGILFINQLAQKSRGTIVDNYSTVDFTMNMLRYLEDIYFFQAQNLKMEHDTASLDFNKYLNSKNLFEKNLQLESNNITEANEAELVNRLQNSYKKLLNKYRELKNKPQINNKEISALRNNYLLTQNDITGIYDVNMEAIKSKTNTLQTSADNVIVYMSIVAGISIVITLFFIFNFPSKIIEPIKELTEKIRSISEKNYDQKLDINTNDELGELSNAFNIMAERLKLYEAKQIDQLLFEQKRLQAVVHSFEDGILFIDENRNIVLANESILQLTGLEPNDILNKSVITVSKQNDLIREIYKGIQSKSSKGSQEIKPIRIIRNRKESFFNIESEEIITYSESEKKETFIGNLVLLRNITKFQERDKAKTNLLATVSHELKTPLSSINISLRLLDDRRIGELNTEQKEVINSLRQQSNRLSRVINELLDLSQIETGNIKLKFSLIKPETVLDIGITALMMQISEKNIELKTEITEGLPEIRIDLEKVAFVFINILNNAIRYSKKRDEIEVKISKSNNDVEFSIKDNGPGISKEDISKLFQRFTQIENKSKQGWGLGLAISKEFMQAQNGKIWVESEVGKGSKFIFSVPVI